MNKTIEFNDLSNGYSRSLDIPSYLIGKCNMEALVQEYFNCAIEQEEFTNKMLRDGFVKFKSVVNHHENNITDVFINYDKKIIVENNYTDKSARIHCEKSENIKDLRDYLLKNKPIINRKAKINFLTFSNNQFNLVELNNKEIQIDLDNNYECNYDLSTITDLITNPKPGLILLTSKTPGTGKSYLIRYLCNQIGKKFVFLPNQVLGNLNNPEFMGFALYNLKNSVLIAEDAESCLIDRQKGRNDTASTLLNITDGIIGDALNLKVICTINNEELVDRALLRKGRLLAKIDFNPLSVEKSNKFLSSKGYSIEVNEPTSLADLYNIQEKGAQIEKKTPVGFKLN